MELNQVWEKFSGMNGRTILVDVVSIEAAVPIEVQKENGGRMEPAYVLTSVTGSTYIVHDEIEAIAGKLNATVALKTLS